uniref:Pyridine nucleotide-disulfide oxidoreductase domain-containing protein 1 n=1 Tax=Tetraselmis sp. GSL018 TaxID=582737 RepID=A0A061SEJ5_9CHLO|mmetsp:Transcript_37703/g.89551  ORF Transcript_37703/g.89551 Transcript_37703/m.89551 type:complete len:199 (+) Transcript_37703:247-843(+)
MEIRKQYVVVGGGVAGVCCAEELSRLLPSAAVCLVSSSPSLKGVETVVRVSQHAEELRVVERQLASLEKTWPNLSVLPKAVTAFDLHNKLLTLDSGSTIRFEKLCLATGAAPKEIFNHPCVLGIRDTDSVEAHSRSRWARGRRSGRGSQPPGASWSSATGASPWRPSTRSRALWRCSGLSGTGRWATPSSTGTPASSS